MGWELTQAHGLASRLVAVEWLLLAVLAGVRWRRTGSAAAAAAGLLFVVFSASELVSFGHPVFSTGLLMPGSWITRLLSIELPPHARRLLEPAFACAFLALAHHAGSLQKTPRRLLDLAIAMLAVFWLFECLLLRPGMEAALRGMPLEAIHFLLCQGFFGAAILGGVLSTPENCVPFSRSAFGLRLAAVIVSMALFSGPLPARGARPALIAAAHYYSWFPENWNSLYAGQHFVPPVKPELGEYDGNDPAVFTAHREWMEEAKLDLAIFDLWTKNPAVRKRVDRQSDALEGTALHFVIQYESLELRDIASAGVTPDQGRNDVYMTPERAQRLAADWLWIAKRYMTKKAYFRINNRPMLFVYASRHLVGPVREAIDAARSKVFEETGLDLYLVGDEVYFHVVDYSDAKGIYLRGLYEPSWPRLTAFDALTCYNSYDASMKEHAGSSGAEKFLTDTETLYRRYQSYAATAGIDFFPGVLPGYNDRGVRPKEDHFVLPRTVQPGGSDFFALGLKQLVRPFAFRSKTFLYAITSWNEWNEGTQIEPAAPSASTAEDDTGKRQFTTGEIYYGYGRRYLDDLKQFREQLESAGGAAKNP